MRRTRPVPGSVPIPEPEPVPISTGWLSRLDRSSEDSKPYAHYHNCVLALTYAPEWANRIWYDESAHAPVRCDTRSPLDDENTRPWTDNDDSEVRDWLQENGIYARKSDVEQAVKYVAKKKSFHPIRNYLRSLSWDGTPCLDCWLTSCFGVEDTSYSRAVGRAFLISAVARVMDPGCQADSMLVLLGAQGLGKSSSVRALAGDKWFTDELPNINSRDADIALRGKWVIEIGELKPFLGKSSAAVNAFLTRRIDRYRPINAKHTIESPRECVFVATTNLDTYLEDEFGARRYWTVECHSVDIDTLRGIRDQLWAEAFVAYQSGEPWWLTDPVLIAAAKRIQAAHYQEDSWDDIIDKHIENIKPDKDHNNRYLTSVVEVLRTIGKDPAESSRADQTRIAKRLKARGLKRVQVQDKDGEKRVVRWRYELTIPGEDG